MRHRIKDLIAYAIIFSLTACAGIGVVATDDPQVKLSDASYLYAHEGRPLIAERLIQEAIVIFQKTSDDDGLGHAYYVYGYFFLSPSIERERAYRNDKFLDKTATFDGRFLKADEYFGKAVEHYEIARGSLIQQGRFDTLANSDRLRGDSYHLLKKPEKACAAYNDSIESYRRYLKATKNAKLSLPSGFTTYEDYIGSFKKRDECK
jgi:tetratricopeptide (TPR) repeat protein